MKTLIFIVISLIFSSLSVAQSSAPYRMLKCDYLQHAYTQHEEIRQIKYSIVPANHYPWGVCVLKPSFISDVIETNVNETTKKEDVWTRSAMNIWNEEYKRYKKRRWGRGDPVEMPGTLFTESCDRERYNIIYTVKKELPTGGAEQQFFADNENSYIFSVIQMDQKDWDRSAYINTMLHELGHALGIHHLSQEKTEVMLSHGQGCPEGDICGITDADFESFLWPYNPFGLKISAEDTLWEEHVRRGIMGCPDDFVTLDDEDTKEHVRRMFTKPTAKGLLIHYNTH